MKVLPFAVVFSLLLLPMVKADTTFSDQGDPIILGDEAPTVEFVEVQSATRAPGTTFWVSGIINDGNSAGDISTANISCYAPTGTEFVDSWDSISLYNASLTWTSVNASAVRVNGTFTGDAYWSLKSANATWTCKVYGKDSSNLDASGSMTMVVSASTGFALGAGSCVFDLGNAGDENMQWTCPNAGGRNETITHTGNTNLNLTVLATDLTGVINSSWTIGVGNMTWKEATGETTVDSSGSTAFTTGAASVIAVWPRGAAQTSNATNFTAWLSYPYKVKAQSYTGAITISSAAS